MQKRANNVTSLEHGTRSPAPPQRHVSPERVVLTLPGTDRPVVRYRVRLHDNHAAPPAPRAPRDDRPDESPADKPRRRVLAETPITTRMLLLVLAVLVGYIAVMVAAFGIAAGAVVVCLGVVVLVATRGRGRR
jgi:hypothetical protein